MLTIVTCVTGQSVRLDPSVSESINDCSGAVNILQPGEYSLQFTGKFGAVNDLSAYPSLSTSPERNSLWCSFKASYDGKLRLNADAVSGDLQLIIFENDTKNVCQDIERGRAEIVRLIKSPNSHVGLSDTTSKNTLYTLELKEGKHIMLCFLNVTKDKCKMNVEFIYDSKNKVNAEQIVGTTKVVDLRKEKTSPALNVQIRNAEDGEPVISNLNVLGLKSQLFLVGSDFYIPADKSGKIKFKADAEGFFFVDKEEPVTVNSDNEIVIWLEPIGKGKSMQLDEIEFQPGTSDFMPTSEPKLRRLKDFLALNATVKIEIQGHVHAVGENTPDAQRMSESRAKRVMKFLVENGIDKTRLTAVGYGNTKPIFPKAKFDYEEQANRRVEILVK